MATARWFNYDGEFSGEGADLPYDVPDPMLLNILSRPAYQAYSLRRLSTTYTGKAVLVRRSSDSTTMDIGFEAESGELDTAALVAFAGGGSAYVVTWYDQSGNSRNLTQATTSRQPRIVNAGTLTAITTGVPGVEFTGSSVHLKHTAPGLRTLIPDEGASVVEVHVDKANQESYTESNQTLAGIVPFNWTTGSPPALNAQVFDAAGNPAATYPQFTTTAVDQVHADIFIKQVAAGASLYRDGVHKTTTAWNPTLPAATNSAVMGALEYAVDTFARVYAGKIGEHIIFDGVLTSLDIAKVQASHHAYFGI